MKKRMIAFLMAILMLALAACGAPAESADAAADNVESLDFAYTDDNMVDLASTGKKGTKRLEAVDWAYVRGGEYKDVNWQEINADNGLTDLVCKTDGSEDSRFVRHILLTFDISGLEPEDVKNVSLQLSITSLAAKGISGGDVVFNIYKVDPDAWDGKTVTWNSAPKGKLVKSGVPLQSVPAQDYSALVRDAVNAGEDALSIRIVQTVHTDAETRIGYADKSVPVLLVSGYSLEGSYLKILTNNQKKNDEIWAHAQKLFEEWNGRYQMLLKEELAPAELIKSDPAQYTKTVYSGYNNPTSFNSSKKAYKTRTFGALTDMSKYVDVNKTYEFDRYGGLMDESMKQEATGFFYAKKIGDRWWFIDPYGYPCYIRALSGITYSYQGSPTQREAALEQFGSFEKWAIANTRHLMDDLYFNAGASPVAEILSVEDQIIEQRGIGSFASGYGSSIGVNSSRGGQTTFSENNTMPVFDPEFEEYADKKAEESTASRLNDPDLLGYTTDNELPMQLSLLDNSLTVDPSKAVNYYTYACAWTFLCNMTGKENPTGKDITDELRDLYRGFVWDRYYNVVCAAVRKYDPNHMLLGTRFLTAVKDSKWVLRFAGLYLDCITINWYSAWEPQAEDLYDFSRYTGLPIMITEFYTKAMENEGNLENTTGAGWIVQTQQDRGDFYQNYTLRLLECKNVVGWHWFQYGDNDPAGNPTDISSKDANKGIFSNSLKEYTDLTDDMVEINKNVYLLTQYFDAKYDK